MGVLWGYFVGSLKCDVRFLREAVKLSLKVVRWVKISYIIMTTVAKTMSEVIKTGIF